MSHILNEICAAKREHIAARKKLVPEASLLQEAVHAPPVRRFAQALKSKVAQGQFALIAEIKKASPSAGVIRHEFDPTDIARAYQAGGATCLSVLTDAPYFQGDDLYLTEARQAVALPILRKDFMLEPYQVIESRIIGADCILLIMAILSDGLAAELMETSREMGLDALVEVHDEKELERALKLNPALVGINNRNLKSMVVDLAVSEALAKHIPPGIVPVSESGIHTHNDLLRMKKSGIASFLVGESLMRSSDIAKATAALLGQGT